MENQMRLQLTIDKDLYNNAQKLADSVGVSLSRLTNALLKWAVETGHAGQPMFDQGEYWKTEPVPKVAWFGQEEEFEPDYDENGERPTPPPVTVVQLILDFRDKYSVPLPPRKEQ